MQSCPSHPADQVPDRLFGCSGAVRDAKTFLVPFPRVEDGPWLWATSSAPGHCQGWWPFHSVALSQVSNIWCLLSCVRADDSHIPPLLTSCPRILALCWHLHVSPAGSCKSPAADWWCSGLSKGSAAGLKPNPAAEASWPRELLSR